MCTLCFYDPKEADSAKREKNKEREGGNVDKADWKDDEDHDEENADALTTSIRKKFRETRYDLLDKSPALADNVIE